MRLRTLTEGEDYTKNRGLETMGLSSGAENFTVWLDSMFRFNANTTEAVIPFLHRGRAISTQPDELQMFLFNHSEVTDVTIEPFVTELGFETKRIMGRVETPEGHIFDIHLCIGFKYITDNGVVDTSKGTPLFAKTGAQSSLYVSVVNLNAIEVTLSNFTVSTHAATNILPLSMKGEISLNQPLKENERINVRASHDISISMWGTDFLVKPQSQITLGEVGYVDSEIGIDVTALSSTGVSLLLPIITSVYEDRVLFEATGFDAFLSMFGTIATLQIDFSVHSVEIVEILE